MKNRRFNMDDLIQDLYDDLQKYRRGEITAKEANMRSMLAKQLLRAVTIQVDHAHYMAKNITFVEKDGPDA